MSRSSRNKSTRRYAQPRRDVLTIANRPTPSRLPRLVSVSPVDLRVFEDRRLHHPEPALHRPAFSMPRAASGLRLPNVNKPRFNRRPSVDTFPSPVVSFQVPERVTLCVRRKRRTEVLHAMGRVGKGIRVRKGRRNAYSSVSCRG